MQRLTILGSTGSIGTQTLDIVRCYSKDLQVVALVAGRNAELLEKQAREFHPELVVLSDESAASKLRIALKDTDIRVESGMDGMIEAATLPSATCVVTAVVGMIGIRPTLAAIKAHKKVCLANKETLVTAGHLVMKAAAQEGVSILPIDSEHSAIFQSLNGEDRGRLSKILLTASGGPFRKTPLEDMKNIKVEDALRHPNWNMGNKITIDSATMVNKGLEVMEAKWLFGVSADAIQVVVHPQSILHSAVMFEDGAIIGQMGLPDMKLPIQYALFYPERRFMPGPKADLFTISQLTFEKPDFERFEGLRLAYKAIEAGGSMPTVFNAANEEAVALFLSRKIGFLDIPRLIGEAMADHHCIAEPNLEEILAMEQEARDIVRRKAI